MNESIIFLWSALEIKRERERERKKTFFGHIKSFWILKSASNSLCVWCFVASFKQCDVVANILILILHRIMNLINKLFSKLSTQTSKKLNSKI